MDSDTCPVRAAWRIARFFNRESCGQCTPCREGSGWIEKIMHRLENGLGREEDIDSRARRLRQHLARPHLAAETDDDLRARPVHSLFDRLGAKMFRDELLVHVKEGGCPFPADAVRRG